MNAECQTRKRRVFYRYEEIDDTLCADEVEILTTDRGEDGVAKEDRTTEMFAVKEGFWRRQFGSNVTGKQRGFDWIMGVLLPIACFCFDPIVFRTTGGFRGALLGNFSVFAYVLAIVSVVAMAGWLVFGDKLKWLNGLFAGLFFAGSIVSLGVGAMLFPFSVIGMFMLIGFLGFTPLFSAIVYSRNAVRAMRASESFFDGTTLKYVAMLAGIFSIVLPWVANQSVK